MDLAGLLEQKGIAGMEQLKAQRQLYRGSAGGDICRRYSYTADAGLQREGERFGEQPARVETRR